LKLAIIIILLLLVGAIIYWRIRPYLKAARRVMETVRAIQNSGEECTFGVSETKGKSGEKLIRCESCGVWLPSSRALAHRSSSNASYCSTACLESSSARPQPQRKSAV